jgi:hypothetical protein
MHNGLISDEKIFLKKEIIKSSKNPTTRIALPGLQKQMILGNEAQLIMHVSIMRSQKQTWNKRSASNPIILRRTT